MCTKCQERSIKYIIILFLITSSILLAAEDDIRLSSIGFTAEMSKKASILAACKQFSVIDIKSGRTVFTGRVSEPRYQKDVHQTVRIADFSAVMAMAARYFAPFDSSYADTCLQAALTSYEVLRKHPEHNHFQQSDFRTGAYASDDCDDRLWAAAELWESTGSTAALCRILNARHPILSPESGGARPNLHPTAMLMLTGTGATCAISAFSLIFYQTNEIAVNRQAARVYALAVFLPESSQ